MKLIKKILNIVSIALAAVVAAVFVCVFVLKNMDNAMEILSLNSLVDFSVFSGIAEDKLLIAPAVVLVLGWIGMLIAVALFIAIIVFACIKRRPLHMLLGLLGLVAFALGLVPVVAHGMSQGEISLLAAIGGVEPLFKDFDFANIMEVIQDPALKLCALVVVGLFCGMLANLVTVVAMALTLIYVIMLPKKEKKVKEKKEKEPEAPIAPAEIPQAGVVVDAQPDVGRLVRKVLVHRSGKVVRVLDGRYNDVTTKILLQEDPTAKKTTENKHFEMLIAAQGGLKEEPAKIEKKPTTKKRKYHKRKTKVVVKEVVVEKPIVKEPVKKVVTPAPAPVVKKPAASRIPFEKRIAKADKALKVAYNELKNELLAYGAKSRISTSGDTFRLHTKTYVKMVVAGKSLKLYMALNPKDYKDSPLPIGDASKMNLYKEIPLIFKVKSDLSLRRAKQLIADAMAKDNVEKGEVVNAVWVK